MLDLNTSFERSLSKLSENDQIFDLGSTILKLWLLKQSYQFQSNERRLIDAHEGPSLGECRVGRYLDCQTW